jgi:subtilisin family serine protease
MEEKVCLMRKTVFTLSMIFILLASLGFSFASSSPITSDNLDIDNDSSDAWWENWIRDGNHNGIDDVLDGMIASDPQTDRTGVFIDYSQHPTQDDVSKLSKFDLEVKYVYKYINTICARNVILSDVESLSILPKVVMIEYEDEIHATLDVGARAVKARQSLQYSPDTVHDMNVLGTGISIAILDSGVDDGPSPAPPPYHNSLDDFDDDPLTNDPKFVAGLDATHAIYITDGSYNPDDGMEGHGTHVAGIAMGTGAPLDNDDDGEYDHIGVAPQANLIDIKVMERWGTGVMGEAIRGIEWCIEHKDEFNIRIMSMSIGGNYNSDGQDAASQAVNAASAAGIVSVISVGNGGSNTIGPPGSADTAITVGASDDQGTVDRSDDTWWSSSNVGPRADDNDGDPMDELKPDVLAPGVNIMSAKSDTPGTYISFSGTSMACPIVAGIVALMLEANPDLTPERVKQILHDTAQMPSGIDPSTEYDDTYNYQYGWGLVDAYEAVRMVQQEDDRPPIISDISIDVSGTSATISWLTHKKANSIIEYGISPSMLDDEKSDLGNYTINHMMTLTDLEEGTDYYFKIMGYDELGIGPGVSSLSNFTTEILPDSKPPDIADIEVVAKSDRTATIFWNTDELADSRIEYGLTTDYGDLIKDFILMSMHSITIFDLEPETTYHFRINSSDASGNYNVSEDFNFTTEASPDETPPSIFGLMVTGITDTTATIIWETSEPSDYYVEVGETLTYGREFSGANSYWMEFSVKLTGLTESTRYYYRVESTDPSGNTAGIGGENTYFFTEGPPDDTPPNIEDGPYVNVTESTATITWMTDEESDSMVEYGLDSNYGFIESESDFVFIHQITLTSLDSETTYHYRVRSKDSSSNENEIISADYIFQTTFPADVIAPQLLSGPDVIKGEYTATITWITDEVSTSEVIFGTDLNYGSTASEGTKVLNHIVVLTGLSPATTYHFRIISIDESGNIMESGGHTFTTIMITIPIEIRFFDLQDGATLTGVVTIQGEVSGGNGPLQSVRFRVDNGSWENLGQGSSFIITLDTSKYADGTHTLYVEAKVGVTGNEMIMVEDVTFVVDNSQEKEAEGETSLWMLIAVIVVVLVIAMMVAISRSRRRSYPRTSDMEPSMIAAEAPFAMDHYPESDIGSIGFIPEEEPPSFGAMDDLGFIPDDEATSSDEAVSGISFVPETTILSEDPEIAFIPDREAVSFALDDEPTRTPVFDIVRCPKCKNLFNADTSQAIHCPECGFSASLKY